MTVVQTPRLAPSAISLVSQEEKKQLRMIENLIKRKIECLDDIRAA